MTILGLDIAKKTFHATLFMEGQTYRRTCANSDKGFADLHRWLIKHRAESGHACMEATGVYWEPAATWLHQQGWIVSVVNPLRIKAFAQTELTRNKTDQGDSFLIARFCQEKHPTAWTPPTPAAKTLQALSRHLEALDKMLTQQRNRLEACHEPQVIASLKRLIAEIQAEQATIRQHIEDHLTHEPDLAHRRDVLCSIPGIGAATATILMAELPTLESYTNARQVAAQAGVTPKQFQSGASVQGKPRIAKIGKARLRKALYFPAIVAMRHNPVLQPFAERLRARGKSEMCIVCAVMRKLCHLVYGVVKHDTKFDHNFAHAS